MIVKLKGFSARRMNYIIAVMIYCFVPVHFYVCGEASGVLLAFGVLLFVLTFVLGFFDEGRGRVLPVILSLFGASINMLVAH